MLNVEPLSPDLVVCATGKALVAPADVEQRIDAIWAAEQARRSQPLHDGALFSLNTRDGARWTGAFVPYRWFVAQLRAPDLFAVLKVRPVAVSGVLVGPDGVVFGRRSDACTQHPGCWELVPSGGLDRGCLRADATLDYVAKIVEELVEETGCPSSSLTSALPFAAVEQLDSHLTDIAVLLSTTLNGAQLDRYFRAGANGEYDSLTTVHCSDVASFTEGLGDRIVEVSRALVGQLDHRAGLD